LLGSLVTDRQKIKFAKESQKTNGHTKKKRIKGDHRDRKKCPRAARKCRLAGSRRADGREGAPS